MAITKKINKNASIKQFTQADLFAQNSSTGPFATLNGTETLSNKTFADPVTLTEVSTPATPSSGFGKIYFKTDGFLYQLNDSGIETRVGSGSGGGSFNYILNSDAEAGTSGWATYADAAGAVPVNGTGGAPTVTWTQSLISPLRGIGSFLLTKDAANRQGEGSSYDFVIADADLAAPITVSFEYSPGVNFYSGSSASDLSDVVVYIYDVTNAQIIQPAPFILTGGVGTNHRFSAQFQSNSNSNSYRLIFHVATTSALSWSLKIDDVSVNPQVQLYGAPVGDWTSYSPVGSWVSNTSYAGRWRRVGDSMEAEVYALTSGAPTSTPLTLPLPTGSVIDLNKLSNSSNIGLLGGGVLRGPAGHYPASVYYNTDTSVAITYTGTRNATMYATKNSGSHSAANTWQNISSWNGATVDTTGGWSTSGVYTVGVAGKYVVVAKASYVNSGNGFRGNRGVRVLRNSSTIQGNAQLNAEGGNSGSGATVTSTLDLNVGDTIQLQGWQTEGSLAYETAIDAATSLSISLVTGNDATSGNIRQSINVTQAAPFTWGSGNSAVVRFMVPIMGWSSNLVMSQDSNTRVVAAGAAGGTGVAGSGTPFIAINTQFDTHGTYNTVTGGYTCPVAGLYEVYGILGTSAGGTTSVYVEVNGTPRVDAGTLTAAAPNITFAATVDAKAGDVLKLNTSAGAINYTAITINFLKLTGPAAIASSELVAARYGTAAGTTIPDGTATIINYVTKFHDTHGAVTTGGAWKFRAPMAGIYRVQGMVTFQGANDWLAGEYLQVSIFKNGSVYANAIARYQSNATANASASANINTDVQLNAGEYIDIRAFQNSGINKALETSTADNFMSVHRVGGTL